jgi:HEXXH motif-containing protein
VNLALDCLERFSDLGSEGLIERIEPGMPRHFLLSTAELQPNLEPCRDEIREIADALERRVGRPAWQNPEVFAQIALLAQAAARGRDPSPVLELLRVQLELIPVSDAPNLADGPIRLMQVDGSIRVRRGDRVERLDDGIVASVENLPARVALPYEGLYRDLVPSELYRDDVQSYDARELTERLSQGADLLRRHAPEILSDLCAVIRTVVLVPDLHDARQWSYNLRLGYFGAIFVNVFPLGRHAIAEALMHEYIHQRLWEWWTYEPPDGLPADTVSIRSPVTDREKPALVMLQALLIYASAHRFYVSASHDDTLSSEERDAVEQRMSRLSTAVPELAETLRAHIADDTRAARIVDRASDAFAEAHA